MRSFASYHKMLKKEVLDPKRRGLAYNEGKGV